MKRILFILAFVSAAGLSAALAPLLWAQVALDQDVASEPTWNAPTPAEVRTQVLKWADELKLDAAARSQIEAQWPAEETADEKLRDVLSRVAQTIAVADPQAKALVDVCQRARDPQAAFEMAWLSDDKTPAFVSRNLRLYVGRWLAQQRFYDDALTQLKELTAADVVDPASLLFYQTTCHHWMLNKVEGLKTVGQLLERRKSIPRRYEQVALLVQADLSELEDESLDHISRRMNDVTRRLDFGHAGQRVRGVEDGIIASLDKLIKDMEDQANGAGQGQGQGQGGGRGNDGGDPQGNRPNNPAGESRATGRGGPGEVASKKIGNRSGWGDLPPKEREEAMQQIGKEFPSHYRDVIEQYFRKLASEEQEK